MKEENPNIDELLNGFIDGELTARQQTEVQRLIAHDSQIAERLRQLQKCKMLVGSLPFAEAPAEMSEQIRYSLERRTLLGQQVARVDEREGARHLLVRKVVAAAAMIGLIAVLGGVIYTIVVPKAVTDKPVAIEGWERPVRKVEAEKLTPAIETSAERAIAQAGLVAIGFNGRLELKTSALSAVDAFINRAIEDNGLLGKVSPKTEGDKSVYALSCSRQGLSLLLADLGNIWSRFDSATLFVETEHFGEQVVVDAVAAEQIVEIVNQDSLERRIEVAKDFAVLNKMGELLPGKEILTAIDYSRPDLISIPKPVLTSSEKTIKKPASQEEDKEEVRVTIVVVGGE
jgi:anti-sigma factor RsiW